MTSSALEGPWIYRVNDTPLVDMKSGQVNGIYYSNSVRKVGDKLVGTSISYILMFDVFYKSY